MSRSRALSDSRPMTSRPYLIRKTLLLVTAAAVAAATAAVPAQYAQRQIDPRYAARAQQQHGQVLAEFGGPEPGPRSSYVNAVGHRVAAYSGIANPGASYRFTTINSAVENAFTVPGGYVYITRQLMALMNDESELAFALAHEVAHVAASHAQQREAVARWNRRNALEGIMLGRIIGGEYGNAIAMRSQLAATLETLSFSRSQEHESDTLGMRYLVAAGYDPAGAPGVLRAIGRASAIEARVQGRNTRQLPEWASTHPNYQNRIQRTLTQARDSGRLGQGARNREAFLRQLDGVYVGDDPEQGIIEGRTFTHPDIGMQFTAPVGYLMQNGTQAVSIKGSAGQAEFGGGERFNGPLEAYLGEIVSEMTGQRQRVPLQNIRRVNINGIAAAYLSFRVPSRSRALDASVVAYQWAPGIVYHLVTLTEGGTGLGPFVQLADSLRRITPAEASQIRPRVIRVHNVRPGETVQSLARQMAYQDFQDERFLSLNGLTRNSRLTPGQKVKLVVFGARRPRTLR